MTDEATKIIESRLIRARKDMWEGEDNLFDVSNGLAQCRDEANRAEIEKDRARWAGRLKFLQGRYQALCDEFNYEP